MATLDETELQELYEHQSGINAAEERFNTVVRRFNRRMREDWQDILGAYDTYTRTLEEAESWTGNLVECLEVRKAPPDLIRDLKHWMIAGFAPDEEPDEPSEIYEIEDPDPIMDAILGRCRAEDPEDED